MIGCISSRGKMQTALAGMRAKRKGDSQDRKRGIEEETSNSKGTKETSLLFFLPRAIGGELGEFTRLKALKGQYLQRAN